MPVKQEAKRHRAVNAETITTFFATLEKLIHKHHIDEFRLWNLDETEYTPETELTGNTNKRRGMRRSGTGHVRLPEFVRSSRATLLAVCSASGHRAAPMVVFKCQKLPY